MAVTFFWRCEGTTLGGDDYSAGDTTALSTGSPTIGVSGARVGTNGLVPAVAGAASFYYFDPTSIITPGSSAVGSIAFSMYFSTAQPSNFRGMGLYAWHSTTTGDVLRMESAGSGNMKFVMGNNTNGSVTVTTTGGAITADAWFGYVVRWDAPNDLLKIEIYDADGDLVDSATSTDTNISSRYPAQLSSLRVGQFSTSQTDPVYIDNFFVANTYAEPLELNFTISAYSQYRTTPAELYVKLLAHSGAASATGVEGVVLNSTRDTVIGEFTGQAFEASLESGEAVLLIPVEDITPDGSTLTTTDTPLVSAYNSTYGTVGLGSATVIEV